MRLFFTSENHNTRWRTFDVPDVRLMSQIKYQVCSRIIPCVAKDIGVKPGDFLEAQAMNKNVF